PLRGNAQSLARAFPRAPRGGGTPLRRTLCADVGILPSFVGNGFPRKRHGGVPDPDGETQRRRTADPRLYRARGSAAARARSHLFAAASPRRRIANPRRRRAPAATRQVFALRDLSP